MRIRSVLIAVILLLLVLKALVFVVGLLIAWIAVEIFLFCSRFGKKGYAAYSLLVVAWMLFIFYQVQILRANRELIAAIESHGDSYADMSGGLLPGHVNYISLGSGVDDQLLAEILELEGIEGLEEVVATDCKISNDGLLLLKDFPLLNRVFIRGTNITPEGVAELQIYLPECIINYAGSEEPEVIL